MSNNYTAIRQLIDNNRTDEALLALQPWLNAEQQEAWPWYLQGSVHHKRGELAKALSCYLQAAQIDASSPAAEAAAMLSEIFEFRNKDLYNP